MAGLFDGMWGNGGSGILPSGSADFQYPDAVYNQAQAAAAAPVSWPAPAPYVGGSVGGGQPDMSVYGQRPGAGLQNLAGGGGGFMDQFGRALSHPVTQFGLALASGRTPQEGMGNAVQAQLQRQRTEQDKWPASIKEYQYAVATGQFQGSYMEFVQQNAQASSKLGMQGVPLVDAEGNVAYGQMSNRPGAGMQLTKPPEGYQVANKPIKQESATHTWLVDPNTAHIIEGSYQSKNVAEGAQQKRTGTETAIAIQRLPAIESTTERALNRLDILENHPGLGQATGFVVGKSPVALTPNARDFEARVAEVQGESWTQGIETMRGLGALSDAEGRRIEQARSRLSVRDVKTEDYKQAIRDIKEIMKTGRDNARKIASGKMKPYPIGEDPSTSTDQGDGGWTTLPGGVRIRQK